MWWQLCESTPCVSQLVDPVADHLRRRAVEDAAGIDDRAGAAVEVLAVEHALGRVVGDRDRADLLDVGRVADVEELHAAGRGHRGDALRDADGVEVARDRQHLAVGRHLLVLPGDVRLHRAERLRGGGVGDVVDRDVLAGRDEHAVADDLGAGGEADVLLDRAEVLDVGGHHGVAAAAAPRRRRGDARRASRAWQAGRRAGSVVMRAQRSPASELAVCPESITALTSAERLKKVHRWLGRCWWHV